MTNKIKILISYVLSNLITSGIVNKKGVTFSDYMYKGIVEIGLIFSHTSTSLKGTI